MRLVYLQEIIRVGALAENPLLRGSRELPVNLPPPPPPPPLLLLPSRRPATAATEWKKMPSLQKALPPELADNVLRLYRECLRRARFIGHQQHNTGLLISMVRQQFKKNMHETDPEKIQKMKDDAARGLINHMLFESEKLSGRKFSA
ncbi:hypothetical protein GUJ93_ZPchr0009g1855 [Zizania palustris]|uniref:Complex 1 LYR protein domain-containing protein n=1 Tax=Zizania palustris TaxID=103762 RepID=A0A8J5VLM0_ZIZPA|nr:hypothetical protein GUJ93_ZPchr0009g1855 [Zizania palustris]